LRDERTKAGRQFRDNLDTVVAENFFLIDNPKLAINLQSIQGGYPFQLAAAL